MLFLLYNAKLVQLIPIFSTGTHSPILATHKLHSHPKPSRVFRPSYVINLFFAHCRALAVVVRHIQWSLVYAIWCIVYGIVQCIWLKLMPIGWTIVEQREGVQKANDDDCRMFCEPSYLAHC